MRGGLAADAKITGGADKPRTENLLPEAVDRDPSRQGILWPHEPLSQSEPVLWQLCRHGWKHVGSVWLDRALPLVVLAPV